MGEIAEDMLDGSMCSFCGVYFEQPETDGIYVHGYPVACDDCWDEDCGCQKQDDNISTF